MKRLSLRTGAIEIELYRLHYRAKQYLNKKFNKYQKVAQIVTVSAFVALVPTIGSAQVDEGFPNTELGVAFTKDASIIVAASATPTITPGESNAEVAARQTRPSTRRRTLTESLRGNYPPCPASFRPFYQEVAPRFGVPWQVIEAIHQVESGKSCHTARRSSGGAVGPMQFLPSTWRRYQWDCTGDGIADITNAYDAICTGAHYIGTGLTGYSLERSIYSYNHSWAYVDKVMRIAREIGYEG